MKKVIFVLSILCLLSFLSMDCYADSSETEPNNDKATADPLASGEGMVGQLSSSSDADWFSISTSGAAVLDVQVVGGGNWYISIQNSSGEVLSKTGHLSGTTQFSAAVTVAGTYYAIITQHTGYTWSGGNYTLTVTSNSTFLPITTYETEPNGEKATADPLASGEGMVGQLSSSSDADWFSISTSGAAVLDVQVVGGGNWYISIQNSSGEVLSKTGHLSGTTQFSAAVTVAGTYYAIITQHTGYTWSGGNYTLTVTSNSTFLPITTYETEPNGEKATADPLASGEGMVGQLSSSSDADWFSISTSGAAVLDVQVVGGGNWYISIQNSSGEVLSKTGHLSGTTQFSAAVTVAGTYYAIITQHTGYTWSGGNYTLTVTTSTGTTTTTTSATSTSTSTTSTSTTSSTPSSSSTTTSLTSSTTSTSSTTTTTIPSQLPPLYVDFYGSCNGNIPCYGSIQEAIDDSTLGSTIKIIAGTYDEDLWVSSSEALTLEGGWNDDFTDRSLDTFLNSLTITEDGQIIVDRLTIVSDEIPTTTTTTTTATTTSTTSSSTTTTIQEYEFDGTWSGRATSSTPVDKYGEPCGYANLTMFINRGIVTGTAVSYPWGETFTLSGIVASDGSMAWGMAVGNVDNVASGTGSLSRSTGSGSWQDVYECSGPWNATKQY